MNFKLNSRVNGAPNYDLEIDAYDEFSSGGNALAYHNNMPFSTFDNDRDKDPCKTINKLKIPFLIILFIDHSCSILSGGGGFWFNLCYHANPTGVYPPKELPKNAALHSLLEWRRWKGYHVYLSYIEFMIRPFIVR